MKKALHIVFTLSLIGLISGGVLSQLYTWAAPLIEQNQIEATRRAIFLVQPNTEHYELIAQGDFDIYRLYDAGDNPLGYAIVHAGPGFQGDIKLITGVSQDLRQITGIEVLDMSETPGLGTIINEPVFKGQFQGLLAEPEVTWIKGAPAFEPNQVEAITGATISSRAVVDIVNKCIDEIRRLEGAQP
jgi:Na+-translocating ferredoxin:NAD+ oxidoreductase subunit G